MYTTPYSYLTFPKLDVLLLIYVESFRWYLCATKSVTYLSLGLPPAHLPFPNRPTPNTPPTLSRNDSNSR